VLVAASVVRCNHGLLQSPAVCFLQSTRRFRCSPATAHAMVAAGWQQAAKRAGSALNSSLLFVKPSKGPAAPGPAPAERGVCVPCQLGDNSWQANMILSAAATPSEDIGLFLVVHKLLLRQINHTKNCVQAALLANIVPTSVAALFTKHRHVLRRCSQMLPEDLVPETSAVRGCRRHQ
jgi:hypothetical protein